MSFQWGRWLAAGALAVTLGCSAEMPVDPETVVEEIRCGRTTCALPNATATCSRGRCAIASCFIYNGDCNHVNADGCEVNLGTDVRNCGGCGTVCSLPHATARCEGGGCRVATCDPGFGDCDGNPVNGCEVNTGSDNNNCGACGAWCGSTCCRGLCIDTNYNAENCGRCGNACPARTNSAPYCSNGTCSLSCAYIPGTGWQWRYQDCDGSEPNGCESDPRTDWNNCGSCGNVCPEGYTCRDFTCTCPEGRGTVTIRTSAADGVSTRPAISNNCGYCGNVCPEGSGCQRGVCVCTGSQVLCWDNRCVDVAVDAQNCGACGHSCAPGEACVSGRCASTCTTCDGRCVDPAIDPANCGACGNVCRAGEFCTGGRCAPLADSTGYVRTVPPADVVFVNACHGTPGLLPLTTGASAAVAMPFEFRFWGALIPEGSLFNVATDAFVNFDGNSATRIGSMPTTAAPNSLIAAFSTAQGVPLTTGPMGICTATLGTAPSRRFVVEWERATAPYPSRMTTELILNEASGAIDIIVSEPAGWGAFAGVENADGTRAVGGCADGSFYCGAFPSAYRVRFVPTN